MKTRLALMTLALAVLALTGSLAADSAAPTTPAAGVEAPASALEPLAACGADADLSLPDALGNELSLFGGGLFPPGPTPCGANTCPAGRFCCNAACGLCSSPGGACTDVYCPD